MSTGQSISVEVHSDGKGSVSVYARGDGCEFMFEFDTARSSDASTEEFVRSMPAVIDQALDAYIKQQEGNA